MAVGGVGLVVVGRVAPPASITELVAAYVMFGFAGNASDSLTDSAAPFPAWFETVIV